jgi:RNA polymerase sigma-70 factor (ECF subfamily)
MTLEDDNDASLLRQMTEGDEHAFLALYHRRHGPVFRFALRMSGNRMVAEEVTQDVFLTLVRDGHGYDPLKGSVASYLFGITRHLVFRHLRERPLVPIEDGFDRASDRDDDNPLHGLARREDVRRVRRAVGSLPGRYREVVVLCDLEGLPYAEAASLLKCPIGTVRSRLSRARGLLAAKLRAEIERHAEPRLLSVGGAS